MPRNGSGTYSLPSGNPVVAGTTIEATWANNTLTDIGSAVTDSLSRNGEGAMLAALRITDGTITAPGLAFSSETNSGFYRTGTTTVRLAIGGSYTMEYSSTGVTVPSGKALTVAGTFALTGDQVQISEGGTGATTAAGARSAILPSYTSNALKVLRVNSGGTDVEWATGASGDVVGPSTAAAGALALFDGTTGKLIKATGTAVVVADYQETVVTANTGTAYTVDIANGTVQILTLTGNCTYTFPTPTAGKSFVLLQKQDGTGSRTVTWPSSVKWPASTAPTITSTASKGDKFVFTGDGTYWWGSVAGQNYL